MKRVSLFYTTIANVCFATASMGQVPAYVPVSGLLGWWPFTGNANDLSANGNNGTVYGASLTADRNNNNSCAYFFNGTNDYISCNLASLPVGSAPRTISAWIQTISGPIATNIDPTVITVAAYGISSAGAVIFGQLVRASIGKGYFESGSSQNEIYSTTTVNNGNWHNLVITYGGPGSRVRMYIDGVKEDSTSTLTLATGTSFFGIGKSPWANTFFQGKIDDLGLWNRALTQDEITTLYHECIPINATTSPNQTVTVGNNTQIILTTSVSVSAYQWQTDVGFGYQNLSNAVQYSGATTATLNIANVTALNNNQLFRCILSSEGCTFTSTPSMLIVSGNNATGIEAFPEHEPTRVYPNPTTDNLTINVDAAMQGLDYIIYNPLGDVILKGELKNEKQFIVMQDVCPGVYFLRVGNSKQTVKIFKYFK